MKEHIFILIELLKVYCVHFYLTAFIFLSDKVMCVCVCAQKKKEKFITKAQIKRMFSRQNSNFSRFMIN